MNLQRKADGKSRDREVQRQNTGREVIRQTDTDTEECTYSRDTDKKRLRGEETERR